MAARYCGDNAQRPAALLGFGDTNDHKVGFLDGYELADGGFAFLEELFFDPLTNHGNCTLFVDIHLVEVPSRYKCLRLDKAHLRYITINVEVPVLPLWRTDEPPRHPPLISGQTYWTPSIVVRMASTSSL